MDQRCGLIHLAERRMCLQAVRIQSHSALARTAYVFGSISSLNRFCLVSREKHLLRLPQSASEAPLSPRAGLSLQSRDQLSASPPQSVDTRPVAPICASFPDTKSRDTSLILPSPPSPPPLPAGGLKDGSSLVRQRTVPVVIYSPDESLNEHLATCQWFIT